MAMAVYWIILSGYFTAMLLAFGLISVALVIGLCLRMNILDEETVPYLKMPSTLSYFFWLSGEIVKANMEVVRTVLNPNMEISPKMVKIPSPQTTDIGRTMFANSITLTPGTVSVAIAEDHILVHGLLAEMSKPSAFKEMSERSSKSVGETGEAS